MIDFIEAFWQTAVPFLTVSKVFTAGKHGTHGKEAASGGLSESAVLRVPALLHNLLLDK